VITEDGLVEEMDTMDWELVDAELARRAPRERERALAASAGGGDGVEPAA
jgi:hypothetical protein